MENRIGEQALRENLNELHAELAKLADRLRRGYLTESEADRGLRSLYEKRFSWFLSVCGVYLRIDGASWVRFCEDARLYRSGLAPDSRAGESWLWYGGRVPDKDGGTGWSNHAEEASPGDRTQFFRLTDAFCLPDEYFMPLPDGIPCPDSNLYPAGGGYLRTVRFSCSKDDGLSAAGPEAVGKRFLLTDRYGLKARLEILGPTPAQKQVGSPLLALEACGSIEGYSSERIRRISVAKYQNNLFLLQSVQEADDEAAYGSFPLWQEAFSHTRKKEALFCAAMQRLLAES